LLDVIGSYQRGKIKAIPFQIWELKVDLEERAGMITMKEDTNEPIQVSQEIPFADFPLKHIKLYFINGVLLLPNEY
jgi:hypothetical protein